MPEDRKQKLEALTYWSWRKTTDWDARFEELVAYHGEHGTLPVTSTAGLGMWINTQRTRYANMPAARRQRLDALEFWTWRVRGT
jgi:hypothetical protein